MPRAQVTVECLEEGEDLHDYMHFSLFAIVLRLLEAMARYTPAAVQALVEAQVCVCVCVCVC